MSRLRIAFVTSEAVPYAKTGGLADVSGVLPAKLKNQNIDCRLFLPGYKKITEVAHELSDTGANFPVDIAGESYPAKIFENRMRPISTCDYFVFNEKMFGREALYVDPETGKDYTDNDLRFIFFSKAVIESLKKLDWKPDIIHANDWQSALVVSLLKTAYKDDPYFAGIKTIITIHNLAYQGLFSAETFKKLAIPDSYFAVGTPFEFWGKVSFLKSAILFADKITTVSPTYAREIQSGNEYGMGLEGVLSDRKNDIVGILNGVDYEIWSPKKDKLIPYNYFVSNLSNKKRIKLELLRQAGMPQRTDHPLFGMISRLDSQKGFDLLEEIIDEMMELDLQFILLGTGNPDYHRLFEKVEQKYPDKMKAFLKFDNTLAHLIEAASDVFLMPSRYEPCGLNQMYSLRYGTVPIVRKTGGLADTVEDFDEKTIDGTGFVFDEYKSEELLKTIKRAVRLFSRRRLWYKIVKQGMKCDFSWDRSARRYISLYESL
jgi:starch synthase